MFMMEDEDRLVSLRAEPRLEPADCIEVFDLILRAEDNWCWSRDCVEERSVLRLCRSRFAEWCYCLLRLLPERALPSISLRRGPPPRPLVFIG